MAGLVLVFIYVAAMVILLELLDLAKMNSLVAQVLDFGSDDRIVKWILQ